MIGHKVRSRCADATAPYHLHRILAKDNTCRYLYDLYDMFLAIYRISAETLWLNPLIVFTV